MTKASDLRFSVGFEQQAPVADPAGGTAAAWSRKFERRAEIKPLKGNETVTAGRPNGVQPVQITVRFDSDTRRIDPAWRAVELVNGAPVAYYSITSAEDMDRGRQWLTILAIAGTADGGDGVA